MAYSCNNPLVVDLEQGLLMTTAEAIVAEVPQLLNLDTLVIEPSSDLTPVPTCADGACGGSSCPFGREIGYLSLISDVTLNWDNSDPGTLGVIMNDAYYTNNEDADVAAYVIDFGDGGATPAITLGVAVTRDISGLPDGFYYGTITETTGGAGFEFWYRVGSGAVAARQTQRTTTVAVNLTCSIYPNYTIAMTDVVTVTNAAFKIDQSVLEVFTTVVSDVSYPVATYSVSESGTLTDDLETAPIVDLLKALVIVGGTVGDIYNTGILRTQCILES